MTQRSFKIILIPVDFSVNTEVAVSKAMEIIDPEGSKIHLLHIVKPSIPESAISFIEQKLLQWKTSIEETSPNPAVTFQGLRSSHLQQCIQDTASEIEADLIVIGKSSHHKWLPVFNTVLPMKIPEQTGIPVLTVKPGALHNRIRIVVVPVTDKLPRNKMTALEILGRRGNLHIHLITFHDSQYNIPQSSSVLLKVFQWLKSSMKCKVEYRLLHGHCNAKSILEYAEMVHADVLLVHPDTETRMGWPNRQLPDALANTSKMQVLALQPSVSY
jgi:nucleotide-binding universal stress UspA family protein